MTSEEIWNDVVQKFPAETLKKYQDEFSEDIEIFVKLLASSHDAWMAFDSKVSGDKDLAHISSLIYSAVNLQAISMHLLICGFLVPSGNTQRQVIESICMALLASKRNLGYLQRYENNKFSTNKAVELVLKKHKILNLNRDALKIVKKSRDFYNQYSHPTMMTVASHMSFEKPGDIFIGGAFDKDKIRFYRKEINNKISLLKTFNNFIEGVKFNLKL